MLIIMLSDLIVASAAVSMLAQRMYIAHLTNLKSEIQSLETEFLAAHSDIEAIERGDWDAKFQQQLDEQSQPQPQPPPVAVAPATVAEDEVKAEEQVTSPTTGTKRKTPDEVEGEEEEEVEERASKRSRRGTT